MLTVFFAKDLLFQSDKSGERNTLFFFFLIIDKLNKFRMTQILYTRNIVKMYVSAKDRFERFSSSQTNKFHKIIVTTRKISVRKNINV